MPEQSVYLRPGDHACHFFEDYAEQKAVILPFFREGLENDEHCIFITSEKPVDDWLIEFQAYGIDVAKEQGRGALQVVAKGSWRQQGEFNAIVKARETLGLLDEVLTHFPGARIAGDAGWALDPDLPVEELCHWEAAANLVYEGLPVRAMCQYKISMHSPQSVHTALRTHANVILDGRYRSNDYYDVARILENEPNEFGSTASAAEVELMLARLRAQT